MTEQDIKYIFKNRDINNRGSYCPMMPNSSCTIQVKTITAKKKTLFEKPAIFRITCVMVLYNRSNYKCGLRLYITKRLLLIIDTVQTGFFGVQL